MPHLLFHTNALTAVITQLRNFQHSEGGRVTPGQETPKTLERLFEIILFRKLELEVQIFFLCTEIMHGGMI